MYLMSGHACWFVSIAVFTTSWWLRVGVARAPIPAAVSVSVLVYVQYTMYSSPTPTILPWFLRNSARGVFSTL